MNYSRCEMCDVECVEVFWYDKYPYCKSCYTKNGIDIRENR